MAKGQRGKNGPLKWASPYIGHEIFELEIFGHRKRAAAFVSTLRGCLPHHESARPRVRSFSPLYTCKHFCLQTHSVRSLTDIALTYTRTDPRCLSTRARTAPVAVRASPRQLTLTLASRLVTTA